MSLPAASSYTSAHAEPCTVVDTFLITYQAYTAKSLLAYSNVLYIAWRFTQHFYSRAPATLMWRLVISLT